MRRRMEIKNSPHSSLHIRGNTTALKPFRAQGYMLEERRERRKKVNKFLKEIFDFLASFEWRELPWEDFCREYRSPTRTLEEIIRSGYFLGCYEPAIILYERAQKQNIPVRFVEMIDRKCGEDIQAHCFVELKIEGKWVIVDPTQREVLEQYPADYVFFSEGPYKWSSFNEFYEAQKAFVCSLSENEKGGGSK